VTVFLQKSTQHRGSLFSQRFARNEGTKHRQRNPMKQGRIEHTNLCEKIRCALRQKPPG